MRTKEDAGPGTGSIGWLEESIGHNAARGGGNEEDGDKEVAKLGVINARFADRIGTD